MTVGDEALLMINHVGVTNVERGDGSYDSTNRRIPVSHKYPPGDLNL